MFGGEIAINTPNCKSLSFPKFTGQEKTLGDISFKLETKIMNFMSFFFLKKYNQVNSSVVNNMQYNLFTIFPLSDPFAEFGFIFIDFIMHVFPILINSRLQFRSLPNSDNCYE
jgi:hypothetical protein